MIPITGILLAAGQSHRFGSNKLLHPMSDGTPVVVHTARKLKAVLPDSVAVVNESDRRTAELLEAEGLQVVINNQASNGMGSSIARGVRACQESYSWVIALADMPYLAKQTIRLVAAGLEHSTSICAPLYGDQRGHPVGFGRAYLRELLKLASDEGARQVISDNLEHLVLIKTHDQGVVADIDYPDDLRAIRSGH